MLSLWRQGLLLVLIAGGARAQNSDADLHEQQAQKALADSLHDAIAMLRHGTEHAKENAAESIAAMAIETTISQPFHPVTFRNAAVEAGIVEELVRLLDPPAGAAQPSEAALEAGLEALGAIATDDPSTDSDNGHALVVCKAGAVSIIVRLLSSPSERVQVAAAGCAAVLAEYPPCQALFGANGAEAPLVHLAKFGNDVAKLQAIAALDMLALNNPSAQERIARAGGNTLLTGIERYGSDLLRATAAHLNKDWAAAAAASKGGGSLAVEVDPQAHARQAHAVRQKHSKLWGGAVGLQRAYAPA